MILVLEGTSELIGELNETESLSSPQEAAGLF